MARKRRNSFSGKEWKPSKAGKQGGKQGGKQTLQPTQVASSSSSDEQSDSDASAAAAPSATKLKHPPKSTRPRSNKSSRESDLNSSGGNSSDAGPSTKPARAKGKAKGKATPKVKRGKRTRAVSDAQDAVSSDAAANPPKQTARKPRTKEPKGNNVEGSPPVAAKVKDDDSPEAVAESIFHFLTSYNDLEEDDAFLERLESVPLPSLDLLASVCKVHASKERSEALSKEQQGASTSRALPDEEDVDWTSGRGHAGGSCQVSPDGTRKYNLLSRIEPEVPCEERGMDWLQATAVLMTDYVHGEPFEK